MAETKNDFTAGRMNKDIDDRLIPENEYQTDVPAVTLVVDKMNVAVAPSLNELLVATTE